MREVFRVHFRDSFACFLDLPVQEIHNYLADFHHLQEAEAASYEMVVTECEVRNALKQVDLNKLPGLNDLPFEVYLTWFVGWLVGFNGISTFVGYLMPNSIYMYIRSI